MDRCVIVILAEVSDVGEFRTVEEAVIEGGGFVVGGMGGAGHARLFERCGVSEGSVCFGGGEGCVLRRGGRGCGYG